MEVKTKTLIKNLSNQHNLNQINFQTQINSHHQKIKDLDEKIIEVEKKKQNHQNKLQILVNKKIQINNKIKSFQCKLEKVPNLEQNIFKIQNNLNIWRQELISLVDKVDIFRNKKDLQINQVISSKKNQIQEYTNILYNLTQDFQDYQKNILDNKLIYQEKYETYNSKLEELKLEFKINGNLRLQDRNTNIIHMIQFKTTTEKLQKQIRSLEIELEDNNNKLQEYILTRKQEYQELLRLNNQKMKSSLNPQEIKNTYLECKKIQDEYQKTTIQHIKKLNDSIQLGKLNINQKKIELSNMRFNQKNKTKNHENTLQKIKQIRTEISKLKLDNQIRLIKETNQSTQHQEKCRNIQNLINNLDCQIEHLSCKNPELREKIKAILNLGIKIKLNNQEKKYYEKNILNLQNNNKELIQYFHDDIKKIDTKMITIKRNITTLNNQKSLLKDKKIYTESKHKYLNEKYTQDTNQKLLQELSSLSNIIV